MPAIPDVSLTYRIQPSPTEAHDRYLVLDIRDDQLTIRCTGVGINTQVLGATWDTSDLSRDSLENWEHFVTGWYSAVGLSYADRVALEKVIVGAMWWMSRTVLGPIPDWLREMPSPTGTPHDPTITSRGSLSDLVAFMRSAGYRTSQYDVGSVPPTWTISSFTTNNTSTTVTAAREVPRDAHGRFTSATPAPQHRANRLSPWASIPATAECEFCSIDKETDEADNGGVYAGWWFVQSTYYNDGDRHGWEVFLCQSCWDDSSTCALNDCGVRSQYQTEARTGRRSYVNFCDTTVHESFAYCESCDRYVDPEQARWNDHMEMCIWCTDNSSPHDDCEECGTQAAEHDENCCCDYCDWQADGADPDDRPEADHCDCEYCEMQHSAQLQSAAYRDRQNAQRRVNGYSHRPYYNYFPSGDRIGTSKRLHIGIEIEVSFKPQYTKVLNEWLPKYEKITDQIVIDNFTGKFQEVPAFIFVKSDSSVNNGFEIVTMPFEPEWGLVGFPWEEAFRELIDVYGAHPEHSSTGQHIHISKDSFDMAHFWKFFQFHQKLGEFCGMVGGRGSRAEYGSFHQPAWKSMKPVLLELSKSKGQYNSTKMYNWYPERYSAINTLNDTTLELRYPSGNIEPESIRKNIQWIWAVYEYTNYIDIKDVTDGALDTPNNFLWWVKAQPEKFADLIKYIERIIPQPKPLRDRS